MKKSQKDVFTFLLVHPEKNRVHKVGLRKLQWDDNTCFITIKNSIIFGVHLLVLRKRQSLNDKKQSGFCPKEDKTEVQWITKMQVRPIISVILLHCKLFIYLLPLWLFSKRFIPAAKAGKVIVKVMGSILSYTQKTHIKFLCLCIYDSVHRVAETPLNCKSSVYFWKSCL